MGNWNDLSMRDKRDIMRVHLQNGIRDLDGIRDSYNTFANGGSLQSNKFPDTTPIMQQNPGFETAIIPELSNYKTSNDRNVIRAQQRHPYLDKHVVESIANKQSRDINNSISNRRPESIPLKNKIQDNNLKYLHMGIETDNPGVVESVNNNGITYSGDFGEGNLLYSDYNKSNNYIGGTQSEQRYKYFNENKDLSNRIDQISDKYKLPKNLLKTNLSVEGLFDWNISEYNNASHKLFLDPESKTKNLLSKASRPNNISMIDVGYDIINEYGEYEKIKPYIIGNVKNPEIESFENEKGKHRNSGYIDDKQSKDPLLDALSLKAAKLTQLKNKVLSDSNSIGIKLNDKQLAYWINLYWNSGEGSGPKLLRQYRGNYIPSSHQSNVTAGSNGEKFLDQYNQFNK